MGITQQQRVLDKMPIQYKLVITRGVALLNEKCKPEWFWRVDLQKLDMASPCRCVLGQLFCCYKCGRIDLGIHEADEMEYGFHEGYSRIAGASIYYDDLTYLWRRLINAMRYDNME